jgi:hypothetical protein
MGGEGREVCAGVSLRWCYVTEGQQAGGDVASPLTPQGEGEAIATFRDPTGNVIGVFHQGGR